MQLEFGIWLTMQQNTSHPNGPTTHLEHWFRHCPLRAATAGLVFYVSEDRIPKKKHIRMGFELEIAIRLIKFTALSEAATSIQWLFLNQRSGFCNKKTKHWQVGIKEYRMCQCVYTQEFFSFFLLLFSISCMEYFYRDHI